MPIRLVIMMKAIFVSMPEVVMIFMFVIVILCATDKHAPAGFSPIAIGLRLILIHFISIPVANTSVNLARSTSQALLIGGFSLQQLWLFWIAPLVGTLISGVVYPTIYLG